MRNRRAIFDQLHVDPRGLQRRDRTFTTRAWPFDADFNLTHAELGGLFNGLLSGTLAGERRTLSTTFEAASPRARPTKRIAFGVRNRHGRVVESRLDMGNRHGDITPRFSFSCLGHRRGAPHLGSKTNLLFVHNRVFDVCRLDLLFYAVAVFDTLACG